MKQFHTVNKENLYERFLSRHIYETDQNIWFSVQIVSHWCYSLYFIYVVPGTITVIHTGTFSSIIFHHKASFVLLYRTIDRPWCYQDKLVLSKLSLYSKSIIRQFHITLVIQVFCDFLFEILTFVRLVVRTII